MHSSELTYFMDQYCYYNGKTNTLELRLWCGDETRTNCKHAIVEELARKLFYGYKVRKGIEQEHKRFLEKRCEEKKGGGGLFFRLAGEENKNDNHLKHYPCYTDIYLQKAFINYCDNPKQFKSHFPKTYREIQNAIRLIPPIDP